MNGSIPLSLALEQTPMADEPRRALVWAAQREFRWVQLDGTQKGMRARELGDSGRRDLAASASRTGLRISGLDLWIPEEHFLDSATVDRAVAAVVAGCELLGDLVRLGASAGGSPVSIMLPDGVDSTVVQMLDGSAERFGVCIADHNVEPATGSGIDPAVYLMSGHDPAAAAARRTGKGLIVGGAAGHLVAARLSDANAMGRCAVGSGKLDVTAYAVALSVGGWSRPVVVDVRGLADSEVAIDRARSCWHHALPPIHG